MARVKTVNEIKLDGDTAVILCVRQDESVIGIRIDAADVDAAKKHKWSVGISPNGYLFTQTSAWIPGVGQHNLRLPRYLMDAPPDLEVDHIDRDPLNCRRSNMRLATRLQNRQNLSPAGTGSLEIRGVSIHHGQYLARVILAGEVYHLGHFKNIDEAALIAANFRAAHMPFSPEAFITEKQHV